MTDTTALEVVNMLNDEIWTNAENDEYLFEFGTNGNQDWIKFLGTYLWDSENDLRDWDDETDIPENLYDYVKRVALEEINKISKLLV